MQLLTQELRRKLPPLYATEDVPASDKMVVAKFFTPDAEWTWYAVEFDGEDTFFGYVDGLSGEWGYFYLSELQRARGPHGLPVERDLYFQPRPFGNLEGGGEMLRGASRTSGYQPGQYDTQAGGSSPFSGDAEYPDDDPAMPDGYDYDASSDAPVRPADTTRNEVGQGGVTTAKFAKAWSSAASAGERAAGSAKVAKFALEQPGSSWDNRGDGFELAGKAWVTFHGDTPFVRWAAKQGLVQRHDGAWRFTVPGTSHDRCAAYAHEMVRVLAEGGVPAAAGSRVEE